MTTESTTSPRKLRAHERATEAIKLRRLGLTYEEIGERLGISKAQAWKSCARFLATVPIEDVEAVRTIELDRLDLVVKVLMPKVVAGDLQAIDRLLRVMERRAKMQGLDAPTKIDITAELERMAKDAGLSDEDTREAVRYAQSIAAELGGGGGQR